jgi:anti-anti-sigma factor
MEKNKKPGEKRALLRLDSSLTIYRADELKRKLMNLLKDCDLLELDIRDVNECDAAGLQLLCSAKKTVVEAGKKLIIAGSSKTIDDVMDRTGIAPDMIIQQ